MDYQKQPRTSEEVSLWENYHSTRSVEARDALVRFFEPSVRKIAKVSWSKVPKSIELDDLHQEGMIALISTIAKFQIERGLSFWTYATPRIRGAILDYLRGIDWVPRLERVRKKKNKSLVVREMKQLSKTLFRKDNGAEETYDVFLIDPKRPHRRLEFEDEIRRVMRGLTARQQLLLWRYYIDDLPMRVIGLELDISESRVSQMHSQLLEFLRDREGVKLDKLERRKNKIKVAS